ncbi:hypothetical protein DB41_IM00020 [Neochlamydia sp. TUME1]|nr:hypothetical protein DB41_IM00020 [Neochlamydia sp. TUME1]
MHLIMKIFREKRETQVSRNILSLINLLPGRAEIFKLDRAALTPAKITFSVKKVFCYLLPWFAN